MKNQSLDDILFEGREQHYGAYIVRKSYNRNLLLGFLWVSTGVILLVTLPKVFANKEDLHKIRIVACPIAVPNMKELPKEDEKTKIEPPKPLVQPETKIELPQQVKTIAFNVPKPVPIERLIEEKTIESNAVLDTSVVGPHSQEGSKAGNPNAIPQVGNPNGTGTKEPDIFVEPKPENKVVVEKTENNEVPKPDVWVPVQRKPEVVNMNDVKALIGYPTIAREGSIEGEVIVKILIDENGKYMQHIVLKQVHPILCKEVEKHISKLQFTPAIQGNKPIKFWQVVPFKFRLQGE